jgi:hypothetical protein
MALSISPSDGNDGSTEYVGRGTPSEAAAQQKALRRKRPREMSLEDKWLSRRKLQADAVFIWHEQARREHINTKPAAFFIRIVMICSLLSWVDYYGVLFLLSLAPVTAVQHFCCTRDNPDVSPKVLGCSKNAAPSLQFCPNWVAYSFLSGTRFSLSTTSVF